MNVWFVDDRAENRATWLASFPPAVHETCALRVFASVPEVLSALEAGDRPDVLFLDFFVDGHYGFEILDRFTAGDLPLPLIIAHSSMAAANQGMLREGAHLAMEKVKGVSRTQSIVEAIGSVEDLRRLVREHRDGGSRKGAARDITPP